MITKFSYKVMTGDVDGVAVIHGRHTRIGERIQLTQAEAKYLLLAGILEQHPLDRDGDGRIGGSKRHRRPSVRDKILPPGGVAE